MKLSPKPYPKMKDSGVPWLGEVPVHWEVRRLRNIADMRVSNVDKHTKDGERSVRLCNYTDVYKNDFIHSGIRFMPATAKDDEIARFRLEVGDVLITKDSESWNDIGVPALVIESAEDLISGYHLALLRPFNGQLSGQFLFRALQSTGLQYQLHVEANGVTRYGLSHAAIKSLCVPLPPPEEQAAIVRYLGYVDGRIGRYIRAKEKLIKLLEEQKQAIIHHAVTRGLDPNAPLKPSGIEWLGDIPAHWEVRRLRSISPRIGVGLVINPSSYFVDEGYPDSVPMLLGNNIVPNGFRLSKVRYIGVDDNQRLPASRLAAGDVVVVRVGAPGVAAVVPENLDGCNCASVMIVRKHNSFESQWLAHAFNSPVVARQIDVVKYGAAQKQFNIGHAVSFLLPVPPVKEQRAIVEAIRADCVPVNTAIGHSRREIALLREYRTRLIADVVTGKVDVRAAAALPDAPEDLEPLADPALALEDEEAPVDPEMEEVEA